MRFKTIIFILIMIIFNMQLEAKTAPGSKKEAKKYNYYMWEVDYIYLINGKEYTLRSKMKLPSIVKLLTKSSSSTVKLPIEEFDKFYFNVRKLVAMHRATKIYKVRLKDGTMADVKKINISFQKVKLTNKVITKQVSKLETKKMRLPAKNIQCVKLIKRGKGI